MPYFDPSEPSLTIQQRDRLRDLFEADALVRAQFALPGVIRRMWTDDVPATEGTRVSVTVARKRLAVAASETHESNPRFLLMVQRYVGSGAETVQEDALDTCMRITDALHQALLRYQSDPTDGVTPRLWDSIQFDADTTNYRKLPGKFWYSDTLFTLYSYQRNP